MVSGSGIRFRYQLHRCSRGGFHAVASAHAESNCGALFSRMCAGAL
jgi:hypothetical protein